MPDARFSVEETTVPGLRVIERRRIGDERGFLERIYCRDELASIGFTHPVVQINRTLTRRCGAVRGMHFQYPPHGEDKLVTVTRGEVFDVAVDLRRDSPSFRRWHGVRLSSDNRRSLFIPKGLAHGFQALTDDCELIYLHTAAHIPDSEGAVSPFDPRFAISWPIDVTDVSVRDLSHPPIADDFPGLPS